MLNRILEVTNFSRPKDCIDHVNEILHEDLNSSLEICHRSDLFNLTSVVQLIVEHGLVKDFLKNDDRDYDGEDFPFVAKSAVESFDCLNKLLDKLVLQNGVGLPYCLLVPLLHLCATHCQEFLWSSYEAVTRCSGFIQKLLEVTKFRDIKSLLVCTSPSESETLAKAFLVTIRPKLTKETWMVNPSMCYIYRWVLLNIKHPHLSDYLADLLPPSLLFIDHHAMRNKVLGIECLNHIIDNIPPSELKMYGRADVVFDALFHLTYLREFDVVHVLYPCMWKFLCLQEPFHTNGFLQKAWGRYDEVYHQLLWNMEMEDNISVRREFSAHIRSYIEILGIKNTKHLNRTKKVLLNYLSIFDGNEETSRINALRALTTLIQETWPRMKYHCEDILETVLILVYDIETDASSTCPEVKEILLKESRECLSSLRSSCPGVFNEVTSKTLKDLDDEVPSMKFLRNICTSH